MIRHNADAFCRNMCVHQLTSFACVAYISQKSASRYTTAAAAEAAQNYRWQTNRTRIWWLAPFFSVLTKRWKTVECNT